MAHAVAQTYMQMHRHTGTLMYLHAYLCAQTVKYAHPHKVQTSDRKMRTKYAIVKLGAPRRFSAEHVTLYVWNDTHTQIVASFMIYKHKGDIVISDVCNKTSEIDALNASDEQE